MVPAETASGSTIWKGEKRGEEDEEDTDEDERDAESVIMRCDMVCTNKYANNRSR